MEKTGAVSKKGGSGPDDKTGAVSKKGGSGPDDKTGADSEKSGSDPDDSRRQADRQFAARHVKNVVFSL